MKTTLFGLMMVLMSFSALAAEEHHFVYKMKDKQGLQVFEFSSTAPSWEKAFEDGAQACYRHFKNGQRLTEDRGLDIIDACANPRSKL